MRNSAFLHIKVALGCCLALSSLKILPAHAYAFDNIDNFSKTLFSFATLFIGFWLIGFFNEARKKIILKKISTFKTSYLYVLIFLIFYGIGLPHFHHLKSFFIFGNESINNLISFLMVYICMVLLGTTASEETS